MSIINSNLLVYLAGYIWMNLIMTSQTVLRHWNDGATRIVPKWQFFFQKNKSTRHQWSIKQQE
jgi:hypothetical protein